MTKQVRGVPFGYANPRRVSSLWPPVGSGHGAFLFLGGEFSMTKQVIAFIDGFNLYHSIQNDKALHKYKWLDLNRLVQGFPTSKEHLEEIRYFTAYTDWNPARKSRHHTCVKALEGQESEVISVNLSSAKEQVLSLAATLVPRLLQNQHAAKNSHLTKRKRPT